MKALFGGMLMAAGIVVLAAGVAAGVGVLLQNPNGRRRRERQIAAVPEPAMKSSAVTADSVTPSPELVPRQDTERNFTIKRTKSEVGYVYWILEGHGKYKCFILCDTWDEAVANAKARLAEIDGTDVKPQMVSTTA